MIFILKYFWGIGVIIGLYNTFSVYKKLKSNYDKNNITIEEKCEINNFIKWYGICFTFPYLFLQIFQLLGNYKTPMYIFLLDFNNKFFILGFISIVLYWILVLYLIIIKNGAALMIKYNASIPRMKLPKDEKTLKLIFIGIVFFGLMALILGNKIMGGSIAEFEKIIN